MADQSGGTEWFWRIVDAGGLNDVPSDEEAALRLLVRKAAEAGCKPDPAPVSDQRGGDQGAPAERAGLLPDGHAPAGHEPAACDPSRGPAAKDWRTVMRNLISEHDRNVCLHEETHRAGFAWTICDQCGRRWADDRGGFKAYEEPEAVTAAWDILKEADTTAQAIEARSAETRSGSVHESAYNEVVAPTPSPPTKEEEARSTALAEARAVLCEIPGVRRAAEREIERLRNEAAGDDAPHWFAEDNRVEADRIEAALSLIAKEEARHG